MFAALRAVGADMVQASINASEMQEIETANPL
jgi:hypothetical protein